MNKPSVWDTRFENGKILGSCGEHGVDGTLKGWHSIIYSLTAERCKHVFNGLLLGVMIFASLFSEAQLMKLALHPTSQN